MEKNIGLTVLTDGDRIGLLLLYVWERRSFGSNDLQRGGCARRRPLRGRGSGEAGQRGRVRQLGSSCSCGAQLRAAEAVLATQPSWSMADLVHSAVCGLALLLQHVGEVLWQKLVDLVGSPLDKGHEDAAR